MTTSSDRSSAYNAYSKYQPYAPVDLPDRTWPGNTITKAPIWCSVDLRDGNQALIEPMDSARKMAMFRVLVQMGFREMRLAFLRLPIPISISAENLSKAAISPMM